MFLKIIAIIQGFFISFEYFYVNAGGVNELFELLVFAMIVYFGLFLLLPKMQANPILFAIVFFQTITNIFFPQWYFQGVQRMRVVTYIQVAFKVLFIMLHYPLITCSNIFFD